MSSHSGLAKDLVLIAKEWWLSRAVGFHWGDFCGQRTEKGEAAHCQTFCACELLTIGSIWSTVCYWKTTKLPNITMWCWFQFLGITDWFQNKNIFHWITTSTYCKPFACFQKSRVWSMFSKEEQFLDTCTHAQHCKAAVCWDLKAEISHIHLEKVKFELFLVAWSMTWPVSVLSGERDSSYMQSL